MLAYLMIADLELFSLCGDLHKKLADLADFQESADLAAKCWLISLVYYRILTYTKGDQPAFRVDQSHRENNSR